jgi:hypothetical protein
LEDLLPCLQANGASEAVEAFNMSKLTNKQAGETAARLREKLSAFGLKVSSAIWGDKSLNGVDDYYLHRMKSSRNLVYDVDISGSVAV